MRDRFSFSRFVDMLKPFVGKLVAVEVEGYVLTGKLAWFGEQSDT